MDLVKAGAYLVPWLGSKVGKHVAYPFKLSSNIKTLESALEELLARKRDVKTEILNAERENGAPTEQINLWLKEVEAIEQKAEETHQMYQQLCRCYWNISPNLWLNYKISKRAAKKHEEVTNLYKKKETIPVIIHMPPPLAQQMPASSLKSPNLESALQDIRDDVYNIIGIWGLGGIGKTHLLKQINNELSRDGAFQVVVFVTCSKECYEEKVQNEIINKLALSKDGSMEQKQCTIYNFLKERSFVLLLDDLWDRVNLDTIGIPDPMEAVHTCKRKVVLTTRSTEVCGQMEVMKKIKVDILKWDDAWSLFVEKVTEKTINSDLLIKKYAVDIVKELGGLPLALITIGRAMRDKIDHNEWELAIMQLKQARLDDLEWSRVNPSVFHTLKFSYDSLKNDTLRRCFLHCSLWPEDFSIRKDRLIELWMGLGLIDKPDIQAAYTIGYTYINNLQSVCLLETDGDYNIKMHDVIRDMALWIANNDGVDSNKWINVSDGTHKELQGIEVFDDTEKLFVLNNYTGIVSFSIKCSSTKLTTLLINHSSLNDTKPIRLELLSQLTMLDLSYSNLKAFPVDICKLVHLQFLNLSGNYHAMMNVPEELEALINLKYFLLRETEYTFPKSVLSKLKSLRMLDLIKYYMDDNFEIFPILEEDFKCLPQFQALGITISIYSMLDFSKLSQISVPLRWLVVTKYKESSLSISNRFLGNSRLQRYLFDLTIRDSDDIHCVIFESESENQSICHLDRLQNLSLSWMKNMKEVIWKSLDPKDVFPRLEYLEFRSCIQLQSISWVINLPRIRQIIIDHCIRMKKLICVDELINSGINVIQHAFPFLKNLHLNSMGDLEMISDPIITFPALEFLDVSKCAKLKKLPFEHSNPPRKLKLIRGSEEWWNNIEIEDASHRSLLQPFFKEWKKGL